MEKIKRARRGATSLLVLLTFLISLRLIYGVLKAPERPYTGLTVKENLVVSVAKDSPAQTAALEKGDRILEINGTAIPFLQSEEKFASLPPGSPAMLLIERDEAVFTTLLYPDPPPGSEIVWRFSLGFSGLVLIAFGFFVLLKRRDKVGLVFFLICYMFAFLTRLPLPGTVPAVSIFDTIAYDMAQIFLPALLLHFFLLFPEESSLLRRLPDKKARYLQWALYSPSAVIFLASQLFTSTDSQPILQSVVTIYFVVAILAALSLFVRSYRVSHLLQKKRLRVAILGTVGAILPITLVTLVLNLFPKIHVPAARFSYLFLLFLPLSFSYAMVRYRFLDIELILKKGILYSLLTAFLAAVYLGIVWGIGGLFRWWTGQRSLILTIISTFLIAVLFNPVRNKLQFLIDRIFFRDRYDYKRVLMELTHGLTETATLEGLADFLVSKLPLSFRSQFAILLMKKGKWLVVNKFGGNASHLDRTFSLSETLLRSFQGSHEPLSIERLSEDKLSSIVPAEDLPLLKSSRTSVILPVLAKGEAHFLLLLGPRLSGEPYSVEDIEFLSTVSEQASVALENSLLGKDKIEKEKLDTELTLAREIQMSLHPREAPKSDWLEISGITVPSGKIGGDCLDFLRLNPMRVGIVLGDVSGKGVPAALLAAGVQAAFRSDAETKVSPSSVLESLNRRLLLLERPERFAGLVYAVFDGENGEIVYSNAGLNAPFLVRKSGEIKRLDVGGVILGISQEPTYQDERVSFNYGDLAVFFTDGVVEQTDGRMEYGEEKLLEVIMRNSSLPAEHLVRAILESVDLFSKESRDDDMTIVVARGLAALPPTHNS